jgi:hypothetical protein
MSLLTTFLDKSISLSHLGNAWTSGLCADIFEAARTISYVETISDKADTLHKYISFADERALKRGYELQIRCLLKRLNLQKVELAIDGKKDLYYGKQGSINVRGIKAEHGANEAWEYLVISVIHPVKLPLMAIPFPMGSDTAESCIELLEYARSLPIQITKVLFDRQFYIGHLIGYLESRNEKRPIPYLIFVPKNEVVGRFIEFTKGNFTAYRHEMAYKKEKSSWIAKTTIAICKNAGVNEKGEPYHWAFATNLKPDYTLIRQYKQRWNIETGFRIMEEGKIKSKSNNPFVRFFYFLLRALLSALWLLSTVLRMPMTFKRYLREIEQYLRRFEVRKPPALVPCH